MQNFIPTEEIYKDLTSAKNGFYREADNRGVGPIIIKREIGQKYGLVLKDCTKTQKIINAILEYLRKVRNHKTSYTNEDVHDFYQLTNYVSQYNKLYPYLMLESSNFISFLLDHQYKYLLGKGIKQYTLDNIDKIVIGQDLGLSMQDKFYLERYRSIKKYYDETYGDKKLQAASINDLTYNLQAQLIEDTYDIRLQLEEYLQDFILECYDTYIYNSNEFIKLHNLESDYYERVREFNPTHNIHHIADTEERKLREYRDNLHFLLQLYTYFSKEYKPSKEERIECSIQHFNENFDKICNKNITKTLISKDANDVQIGQLIKSNFGFYFIISYNDNKKIYINFLLQHDTKDVSDMDKFVKHPRLYTTNVLNNNVIDYQIKVTIKPLNKNLNESFNYNINLSLDDYDNIKDNTASKNDIIDTDKTIENYAYFFNQFVDLGLPSGTLWAKYNLGVDYENLDKHGAWHGNFYAWAETESRSEKLNYVWTTYKWARGSYNNLKKYINGNTDLSAKNPYDSYHMFNDDLVRILPEDDAAYQHLYAGKYHSHIPTKEQCLELYENTVRKLSHNYNGIIGLNGVKLISKINGKHIFLPFSGHTNGGQLYGIDNSIDFWTSDLGKNYHEYQANAVDILNSENFVIVYFDRAEGLTIRPVFNF